MSQYSKHYYNSLVMPQLTLSKPNLSYILIKYNISISYSSLRKVAKYFQTNTVSVLEIFQSPVRIEVDFNTPLFQLS